MMVIGGVIATVAAIANYAFPPNWGTDVTRMRTIINSVAVWAIAAPVFVFHWQQVQKSFKNKDGDE